jgi:hypothetical protein
MQFPTFKIVPVLLVMVFRMFLGAFWYGAWSKPFVKATFGSEEELQKAKEKTTSSPVPYIWAASMSFVIPFSMAIILEHLPKDLVLYLKCCFMATIGTMMAPAWIHYQFENKPAILFFIHYAYDFIPQMLLGVLYFYL